MKKLLILFAFLVLVPLVKVDAAVYYVDFTRDIVNGNGLATTTPFNNLDSFTEVARSAGDIAFVRRGVASTTNVTDLNFTSDGTIANPIIISADYDNLWNDFASSTQTYTVAVATSTFTASAAQSEIIVGEWVYVDGDCFETYNSTSFNQCEFAYEVSAVSSTSISFYLPYKGDQTGAGHTLRVLSQTELGSNPQWNVASGNFEWIFNTDNYWFVKGMDIRGTDLNGNVENITSIINIFDTIFTGNTDNINDRALTTRGSTQSIYAKKIRVSKEALYTPQNNSHIDTTVFLQDVYADGTGGGAEAALASGSGLIFSVDIILINASLFGYTGIVLPRVGEDVFLRNVFINGVRVVTGTNSSFSVTEEDLNGVLGQNQYTSQKSSAITSPLLISTTTASLLRSGGGPVSIKVIPSTNIASIWIPVAPLFDKKDGSPQILLFDYPIYTDTTSKQYDVYFMSTSTANFTTDPLNTELWIECEYWAHETNATSTRKIKKSTGVVDFNGSTAWQSLSVTCVPTQTGILYLRAFYSKTKEASVMNEFFVDGTPVIQ